MTFASMAAVTFLQTMWSGSAVACDGKAEVASTKCTVATSGEASDKAADPSLCSRRPELMGRENCAWTTSMMAQRILEEGTPWSYVGRLSPSDRVLASKVAAPYTVGPDKAIYVLANEVLDAIVRRGVENRVQITGRLLEVDGIRYFVATDLTEARS